MSGNTPVVTCLRNTPFWSKNTILPGSCNKGRFSTAQATKPLRTATELMPP